MSEGVVLARIAQGIMSSAREECGSGPGSPVMNSIVIKVPDGMLGATTVCLFCVTAFGIDSGGWRQINRAGKPMIQPMMFSIVVNAALSDGLHRGTATGRLRPDFPYVALPVSP